jgi:RNA polymerase sigma-70 factor (ECF subfamily)
MSHIWELTSKREAAEPEGRWCFRNSAVGTHWIRGDVQAEIFVGLRAQRPCVSARDLATQAFADWHNDVYRYALSIGLGTAAAQEITQETFLRFYVALDKRERIENQKAWLFRVAHNLAINLRLKESRLEPWTPDLGERFVDPCANPEQALLDREKSERLRRAVEGLSVQQRECLHLRAAGFRYREIGEIIGIKTSTVSEFLKRAIDRLRRARHE